jgi:hypothetical protein
MKTTMAFVVMAVLLTGCHQPAPAQKSGEADLRPHIIGSWWSDDQWFGQPFSLVTFYPDGRFARSNTNRPINAMREGYWRVNDTTVFLTLQRDAAPADALQVFTVDHINDHDMVFTNPTEKLQIRFTR